MANYLTFASAEPFTLAVGNAKKNWDGTLYYSTDAVSWNEWDGTTVIASAEHGGEQKIYMRGAGNSVITAINVGNYINVCFVLTGSNIRCVGNIENLLDYATVANGKHPVMGHGCFSFMFYGCTALITSPELPATTLTGGCYFKMFYGCSNLITVPSLPAVILKSECYAYMFDGCTSLRFAETQSDEYPNEYRIPTTGDGESASSALYRTFFNTGGTFKGTIASINTTYYTANDVIYPSEQPKTEPLDPQSLTAGWLVGKRIAAMRGKA